VKIFRILLIAGLFVLAIAAPTGAATPATLPSGATIAGVDVSGLDSAGATAKLQSTLPATWERPVDAYFRLRNGNWKLIGFERTIH